MLDIFKKAKEDKYAIGAFNISNLEQAKAIVGAAQKLKSPVIISTSEGESKFVGKKQARAIVDAFKEETGLPIFLHLDHGKSLEDIKKAIEAGYDSIHFDGSKLDFEENIEKTKEIVKFAKEKGGFIISNDRFKDHYNDFGKEWIKNKRITFTFIEDNVYFDKIHNH